MHEAEKLSLEQIEAFLNASQEIRFEGEAQKQIYHWIEQVLGRQEYQQQSRPARRLMLLLTGVEVKWESYPIQDEPEGEVRFQHKMGLERMAC